MCGHIASLKPDVVITEKGLSDLAAHFLTKARQGGQGRAGQGRGVYAVPV